MMSYVHRTFEANRERKIDDSGFYYGFMGKVGIDALYDISENVSVLAGFEYEFTTLQHKIKDTINLYRKRNMSGPSIRIGFRFLM
jgi:hypothetical protein